MPTPRQPAASCAYNRTRQSKLASEVTAADTFWARLCGLSWKAPANFLPGHALWIQPCEGVHTFFMRFPLDVIYLDKNNVVIHTAQNLRPWRIARTMWKSASVLELPVGTVRESGTVVGDVIVIGPASEDVASG